MPMSRRSAIRGLLVAPALMPVAVSAASELPAERVSRLVKELSEALRNSELAFKKVTVTPDFALHSDYRGKEAHWQIRHLASEIRNEAMRLDPTIRNVWCGYDENIGPGTGVLCNMVFEREGKRT